MPIQLDKILSDIAEEKVLHPNYPSSSKKQVDDAWMRVGKKNKLSGTILVIKYVVIKNKKLFGSQRISL